MTRSAGLALYLAASRAAGPLAPALLRRRAARGREDPARLSERLGVPGAARPPGRLAWVHGASVGESLSALPLLAALKAEDPDLAILVTSGTVASARRLAALLPEGAMHQFAPVDTRRAVRRFLDHWRPDLAIRVESEIWPRTLAETARRGVPMMLVNARLSARSARGWARVPAMARRLIGLFARIVTQDGETRDRLIGLGADPGRVREGGNLKNALPPPGHDPAELASVRAALGGRAVWLAASTHPGEEATVAEAQAGMPAEGRPLLILAPRHPERGPEIAEALRAAGLSFARRADGEAPAPGTDVWLADTFGEMGLWYRLAPVAFVAGSLVQSGGHNPFEPAALGSAILHGPDVANFAPAYAALAEAGGACEVSDAAGLGRTVRALLADPAARRAMTEAAAATRAALVPEVDRLAREALALMERR